MEERRRHKGDGYILPVSRNLKIAGDLRPAKINERVRRRDCRRRQRDAAVVRHQQPRRRGCRRLVRLAPSYPRHRSPWHIRLVLTSTRRGSCKRTWRRDAVVRPRGHGSLHRQGALQGQDPAGAHEGRQTGERPRPLPSDDPVRAKVALPYTPVAAAAACDADLRTFPFSRKHGYLLHT